MDKITYSFDAAICIEADSKEKAVTTILGHCIGRPAHIAISLHDEGTLNHERIKELTEQLDAVRETVPMFLEDYQVDDFWAEVKLQAGELVEQALEKK